MSDDTELVLTLAQARAAGTLPRPADDRDWRRLTAHAARAGRTVAEASGGRVVLGWLDGSEPTWPVDGSGPRLVPPPKISRTFAACLRACWPDRAAVPYPGVPARVDAVLAAVAALGSISSGDDVGEAGTRHAVGALTTLAAAGYVELDEENGLLRLGPQVAAWSTTQVDQLRAVWPRLPAPPPGTTATAAPVVATELSDGRDDDEEAGAW